MILLTGTLSLNAALIERRPLHRETELGRRDAPAAVILIPDSDEYRRIGRDLATAIEAKTGVKLEVENASNFTFASPRTIRREKLSRHFILLGQFWNNSVLERLYANFYSGPDSLYTGPGGYEVRTVCSPFRPGHNCIVASGSDLEGCQKAVDYLLETIQTEEEKYYFQFWLKIKLTGAAAEAEAESRAKVAPILVNFDQYCVFGHPEAKSFWDEDPHNLLPWNYRNLGAAATFGRAYWQTGNRQYADAFQRIVLGCREQIDKIRELYKEGRPDLMDYSGAGLTIAWDLIEESDAFTEIERQPITDFIFDMAFLNRNVYYLVKCKDLPLETCIE